MKIDLDWLTSKTACGDGKQWFRGRFPDGGEYQDILVSLAADGKMEWAGWLLGAGRLTAGLCLRPIIEAAVKYVFDHADWSKKEQHVSDERAAASATGYRGAASATGDQGAASATGVRGAASATGDQGAASATGDQGAASATGYQGAASATGDQGAASAVGFEGMAKAEKGGWITIAEWKLDEDKCVYERIDVKTTRVDGKKIKADAFYQLKKGKFVEVKS